MFRCIRIRNGLLSKYVVMSLDGEDRIVLPDTVKVIKREAFTKYNLPSSVWEKEYDGLSGSFYRDLDYEIKELIIPASVETIEQGAFFDAYIYEITIDENSPAGVVKDGILYSKDGKMLKFAPDFRQKNIVVSKGTEIIGEEAIMFKHLSKLVIPDSVKRIESKAIASSDIGELIVGAGIEYVAKDAFDDSRILKITASAETIRKLEEGAKNTHCFGK